jgi:hypothetical protein
MGLLATSQFHFRNPYIRSVPRTVLSVQSNEGGRAVTSVVVILFVFAMENCILYFVLRYSVSCYDMLDLAKLFLWS